METLNFVEDRSWLEAGVFRAADSCLFVKPKIDENLRKPMRLVSSPDQLPTTRVDINQCVFI